MLVFALASLEEEKPTSIKQMQFEEAKQFILVHATDPTVTPKLIAKSVRPLLMMSDQILFFCEPDSGPTK